MTSLKTYDIDLPADLTGSDMEPGRSMRRPNEDDEAEFAAAWVRDNADDIASSLLAMPDGREMRGTVRDFRLALDVFRWEGK